MADGGRTLKGSLAAEVARDTATLFRISSLVCSGNVRRHLYC